MGMGIAGEEATWATGTTLFKETCRSHLVNDPFVKMCSPLHLDQWCPQHILLPQTQWLQTVYMDNSSQSSILPSASSPSLSSQPHWSKGQRVLVLVHFCCNSIESVVVGDVWKECSMSTLTIPSSTSGFHLGICACYSLPSTLNELSFWPEPGHAAPSLVSFQSVTRSRDGAGLVHRRNHHSFTGHYWPQRAVAYRVSEQSPTKESSLSYKPCDMAWAPSQAKCTLVYWLKSKHKLTLDFRHLEWVFLPLITSKNHSQSLAIISFWSANCFLKSMLRAEQGYLCILGRVDFADSLLALEDLCCQPLLPPETWAPPLIPHAPDLPAILISYVWFHLPHHSSQIQTRNFSHCRLPKPHSLYLSWGLQHGLPDSRSMLASSHPKQAIRSPLC